MGDVIQSGLDLDRRCREIFAAANRHNALSSAAALVELGFSGRVSYAMIEKIILAKEKRDEQSSAS